MLTVVIRTKNQENALGFLLKILNERYSNDISEIIVLDNLSTDKSKEITILNKARFVTIDKFSYGESANIAANEAKNDIIVIFSAHSYPVSHDFFKLIIEKFKGRENELAGLRCLHNKNDYFSYINNLSSKDDYNKAGLIFAGSAFNKKIWIKHNFKSDIHTFEDKEWSKRVIKNGFKIEFVPSIFCYDINRTKKQLFFRFKNEIIGSYQLHKTKYSVKQSFKMLLASIFTISKNYFIDLFYTMKKFLYVLNFLLNKPKQF